MAGRPNLHRSSDRSNDQSDSHGLTNGIWTENCFVSGLDWRALQDDRSLAFDGDESSDEDDDEGSGLDCFAYF